MTSDDLLRAILARPDDDDLRLEYASLCDRRGHRQRAAFIRAQIAAVRCRAEYQGHFIHANDLAAKVGKGQTTNAWLWDGRS